MLKFKSPRIPRPSKIETGNGRKITYPARPVIPTIQIDYPAEALDFLEAFPPIIGDRGEDYFFRGAVEEIEILEAGQAFRARVRGGAIYHVEVYYRDDFDEWSSDCDCPYDRGDCKHAYAAMRAILSRSGIPLFGEAEIPQPKQTAGKKKKSAEGKESLWEHFVNAKGAPPSQKEEKLLRAITALYQAIVADKEYLCGRSLKQIGIGPLEDNWSQLGIWPEEPADDYEFWQYVVLFAQENKLKLPGFMTPVNDLGRISKKIADQRRHEEVGRWQHYFRRADLDEYSPETASHSRPASELRLKLQPDEAILEILLPDKPDFTSLTNRQFQGLPRALTSGEFTLTPVAEVIWGRMEDRTFGGGNGHLRYDEVRACNVLYGICDTPGLRDAIVHPDGAPIPWSSDLLRWHLSTPSGSADDTYHMELVHADGSPVRQLTLALNGSPSYFLADGQFHAGPPFDPERLNPREGVKLPREAVENRQGIAFLHQLGVDLPEPLARRVHSVKLLPRLICRLQKGYQEQCEISILAVTQDGEVREEWRNRQWHPLRLSPDEAGAGEADVEIVNRQLLSGIPEILDPLNPKTHWDGTYTLKVSKKFPDRFCTWLDTLPAHVEVQLEGELAGLKERVVSGSVQLKAVETEIDWFDLSIAVEVEDTDLTPEEMKLLLNAKGGWVRLEDKGWRRLAFKLSAEDDEQLARLGLNARELSDEPQRMHALQLAAPAAKKFLPAEQSEKLRLRAEEIQARVTPDIPTSITATLRPYQIEGFHFLAYLSTNHFGGILADDMGLGKTLQALTWLIWLREKGETGPSLVVCPKSVMDNWHAETERFTKGLSTRVWHPGEIAELPERVGEADLHVINYHQLRKLGESLLPVRFLVAILDEGQNIKNPSSQTAQTARALNAAHRLVLTGTPIENRLLDLWSLMTYAMPGILGSRSQFGKLYNAKDDPFARLRLSSRVRPFLIRRTKDQVAQDLPERIEEDLYCEIEGEQKKLYQAERKRAQQILLGIQTPQQLHELRFNFLTSLLHLRQICCHPRLFRESSKAKSAKLEAVLEQLETIMAEGNKVLVFSQFVQLLELIEPELIKNGWTMWKLTGKTENRGRLVESFQKHDGPGVFLISLKAGGSGLNLTAASYVVLFDPWWNPAVENQAIDRTHRIGQTSKVIAYRLLIKNSIEEKIRELQKQKQALAEDVLGEEKFSQNLTISDFQYLLSD